MVQEKLTRNELREMHIGQTRIIQFTHPRKVSSARVMCTQMKKEEGIEFTTKTDYASNSISITRTN
jgi:hypothetical protein